MSQPPDDQAHLGSTIWRQRIARLRAHLRSFALASVGIALVALFVFSALNPQPHLTQRDIDAAVARALASATPPPPAAVQVYEIIQPSLVRITTRFLNDKGETERGRGTGIVLDESGTILTSLHVVQSVLEIQLLFADGSESNALLIASDPAQDIAVLRTLQPPPGLIPATLGNPNYLRVGDEAIVVGNPFGLSNSLSVGAISGLNRTFVPKSGEPMSGLIQFDAAVNPGNSGGPLLNRDGEVVGIVTALINPTDQDVFIGIGFAVPIDVAAGAAGEPPY
jgi:S1-C subfamily serine protease